MTPEYEEDRERVDEQFSISEGQDDVDGYRLHVTGTINDVEVWLNSGMNFNGIAIGGGESRRAAVEDAVRTLEGALGILKEQMK